MSTEPRDPDQPDDWTPQACTLPTAERPLRVAEFDELFASSLLDVTRLGPTRLRLRLAPESEATARDLTARESSCCSFFGFDYTADPENGLLLDITVPVAHVEVLDGLALRAAR
ncbi:hypothetical protein [Kribbella sp. NPDC003557]|uniref:hypothetical protein n=1 Tax=Kribbella sp. NPDC003557 TaxID=3154449 RepID=UPI0033A8CC53